MLRTSFHKHDKASWIYITIHVRKHIEVNALSDMWNIFQEKLNKNMAQKAALSTSHQMSSVSSFSSQMTFVKNGLKCKFVLLSSVTFIVFELSQ